MNKFIKLRNDLFCKYCNKQCKNLNSLKNHEIRCKNNPNKIIQNNLANFQKQIQSGERIVWNKGLTKETDIRVKQASKQISNTLKGTDNNWRGKHLTEKHKQHISNGMKGNINYNPNKTGRGKKGWYKGFYCSSRYELAFVIYCLDHNIPIQRYKGYYNYIYKNKQHKYYPDFIINNVIYEIKGFHSELTNIKIQSVTDKKIIILYPEDLIYVFDYIKNTYNKDPNINLEELYEK